MVVRKINRLRDDFQVTRGNAGGERSFARDLRQAASVDIVHGEIILSFVLSHLVDGNNVGMLQAGRRRGFRTEPLNEFGRGILAEEQQLDCDNAAESDLPRLVNYTHAAVGDFLQQLVITEVANLRPARPGWRTWSFETGRQRVDLTVFQRDSQNALRA